MGAAVPKGLLDLPVLNLCLLLASVTRGCSYLLAAAKYRIAGQFLSLLALVLGDFCFAHRMLPSPSGSVCCAQTSHCADLTPTNRALPLVFTAYSSAASLLRLFSFTAATSSQFSPRHLIWCWRAAFPLASSQILHTGAII